MSVCCLRGCYHEALLSLCLRLVSNEFPWEIEKLKCLRQIELCIVMLRYYVDRIGELKLSVPNCFECYNIIDGTIELVPFLIDWLYCYKRIISCY